jgi:hypothetical protein
MAIARMPEAFFDLAAHHLPPEQAVGPAGGRPPRELPRSGAKLNTVGFRGQACQG